MSSVIGISTKRSENKNATSLSSTRFTHESSQPARCNVPGDIIEQTPFTVRYWYDVLNVLPGKFILVCWLFWSNIVCSSARAACRNCGFSGFLFIYRIDNGFCAARPLLKESDGNIERGAGIVFRSSEQHCKEADSKSTYNTVVLRITRYQ